MSISRFSLASVFTAGILSITTLASARQPPALLAAQARADAASCQGAAVVAGSGYRDARLRLGAGRGGQPSRAEVASERGYRNAFYRFGPVGPTSNFACHDAPSKPRLSASR